MRAEVGVVRVLDRLARRVTSSHHTRTMIGVLVAVSVLFGGWLYARGVALQWEMNRDPEAVDQGAYLGYAESLHEFPDRVVGDRVRMPLFPYILAVAGSGSGPRDQRFERAKLVAVVTSVVAVAAAWALGWWILGAVGGALVAASVAFGVFLVRAPWVQADTLWYVLFAASLFGMCALLQRPRLPLAVVVGVTTGLAQLSKPGAQLLIALFVLTGLVIAFRDLRAARREQGGGAGPLVAAVAVVGACFLLVVAPYAVNSARVYGSPWFNVTSARAAWYDSPADINFDQAFDDRSGPSASSYLSHHSLGSVVGRIRHGLATEWSTYKNGVAAESLVFLQGVALFAVMVRRPRRAWQLLVEHRRSAAFVGVVFAAYILAYSWYMPIGPVPRYAAVLVLPFFIVSTFMVDRLARDVQMGTSGQSARSLYYVMAWLVLAFFAGHVATDVASHVTGAL